MQVPDQVLEGMGRTIRGRDCLVAEHPAAVVYSPDHQWPAAQSSSEAK